MEKKGNLVKINRITNSTSSAALLALICDSLRPGSPGRRQRQELLAAPRLSVHTSFLQTT